MNPNYLSFEQPILDLLNKIDSLRQLSDNNGLDIKKEIAILEKKSQTLTENIFKDLTAAQIAQIARHPLRPYSVDYINNIFTDIEFLHGDRHFSDDKAIVGGIAKFKGQSVVFIGQQKGRSTKEKVACNFGMPRPEGYRKACRLMKLAERFKLPVITFIDTPGAYPGIDAEERGQSEAIAYNLSIMSKLSTPIISIIIGEGGSGGALAIGVADRMLMLEYSIYSVISPEGCAAILWKDASYANDAATALGVTAPRLKELGLIDEIVPEPLGSAHRAPEAIYSNLSSHIEKNLKQLQQSTVEDLVSQRYQKITAVGSHVRV